MRGVGIIGGTETEMKSPTSAIGEAAWDSVHCNRIALAAVLSLGYQGTLQAERLLLVLDQGEKQK